MVYIYKKKVDKKDYYYLRASKRLKGKQVTKDIAYLGPNIEEARKNFIRLAKDKQEIKKSYRAINLFLETEYYLNKAKSSKLKKDEFLEGNLEEIEACKLHYNKVFNKLDELSKKEILENFAIEFSYNTTSIEGNTITLDEAKKFFETGKTPTNRTLREIYDIQNTKEVILWLLTAKKKINDELIIELHKKLLKNIDKRTGYRTADVRVFKSHFDASPGIYVKSDMKLLLDWYNKNKEILHPFVLATIFHHKFEKIHPFFDGNGRAGRMLMNYILIKEKYPPVVIYKRNRNNYLDALGSADNINLIEINKRYKNLVDYISQEATNSYWNLFL
ncbi:Fic family protein [Candidatus Pacearchaeota archaeon]|nr:Fic family protein [Candidatus Pacearchaeota archaeon]